MTAKKRDDVVSECINAPDTVDVRASVPLDCLAGLYHRSRARSSVHIWRAGQAGRFIHCAAAWAADNAARYVRVCKRQVNQELQKARSAVAGLRVDACAPVFQASAKKLLQDEDIAGFEMHPAAERMQLLTRVLVLLEATANESLVPKTLAKMLNEQLRMLLSCKHLQQDVCIGLTTILLHVPEAFMLGDITVGCLKVPKVAADVKSAVLRMFVGSIPGAAEAVIHGTRSVVTRSEKATAHECLQALLALGHQTAEQVRSSLLDDPEKAASVMDITHRYLHDGAQLMAALWQPGDRRAASMADTYLAPRTPYQRTVGKAFRRSILDDAVAALRADGLTEAAELQLRIYALFLLGDYGKPPSTDGQDLLAALLTLQGEAIFPCYAVPTLIVVLALLLSANSISARDCGNALTHLCYLRPPGHGLASTPPSTIQSSPLRHVQPDNDEARPPKRARLTPGVTHPPEHPAAAVPSPSPPVTATVPRSDAGQQQYSSPGAVLLAMQSFPRAQGEAAKGRHLKHWLERELSSRHCKPVQLLEAALAAFISCVQTVGLTRPAKLVASLPVIPPVDNLNAFSPLGQDIGLRVFKLLLERVDAPSGTIVDHVPRWLHAQMACAGMPLHPLLVEVVIASATAAASPPASASNSSSRLPLPAASSPRVPLLSLQDLEALMHSFTGVPEQSCGAAAPLAALYIAVVVKHAAAMPRRDVHFAVEQWVDALWHAPLTELLQLMEVVEARGYDDASVSMGSAAPGKPIQKPRGFKRAILELRAIADVHVPRGRTWTPPAPLGPGEHSAFSSILLGKHLQQPRSSANPDKDVIVPAPSRAKSPSSLPMNAPETPLDSSQTCAWAAKLSVSWSEPEAMHSSMLESWEHPLRVCALLQALAAAAPLAAAQPNAAPAVLTFALLAVLALAHSSHIVVEAFARCWAALPHRLFTATLPFMAWRLTQPVGRGRDCVPVTSPGDVSALLAEMPALVEVLCLPQALLQCDPSVWHHGALVLVLLVALDYVRSGHLFLLGLQARQALVCGKAAVTKAPNAPKAPDVVTLRTFPEAHLQSMQHLQHCCMWYALLAVLHRWYDYGAEDHPSPLTSTPENGAAPSSTDGWARRDARVPQLVLHYMSHLCSSDELLAATLVQHAAIPTALLPAITASCPSISLAWHRLRIPRATTTSLGRLLDDEALHMLETFCELRRAAPAAADKAPEPSSTLVPQLLSAQLMLRASGPRCRLVQLLTEFASLQPTWAGAIHAGLRDAGERLSKELAHARLAGGCPIYVNGDGPRDAEMLRGVIADALSCIERHAFWASR